MVKVREKSAARPALVVFDMAGTTVHDDGGAVARCLVAALEGHGYQVPFTGALALMGIPKPDAIGHLLRPFVPDAAERGRMIPAIHQDFLQRMRRYYREDPAVRSIAGTEEVFARLRAAGIRIGLDTGFGRDTVDTILERLGWSHSLDATVASDEVAYGRPYPDMIYHLMRRLGVGSAAEVAKVGDTPVDLQQGDAAGCGWVIGVTEGSHTHAQLEPYPHTHLIPDITGLVELWKI